ncbi:hypothetical protein, partial [Ralstonia solanacearum]|uniref:hypothetical protein n=1 Tax=Ralstonia solanacearum TaxID=305 RepID=UPI001E5A5C56
MLKNFAINFVYRVATLSAAEKRDYEELFCRCQQLVEEFFLINSLPTPTTPRRLLPPIDRRTAPHLLLRRLDHSAFAFASALCRAAR